MGEGAEIDSGETPETKMICAEGQGKTIKPISTPNTRDPRGHTLSREELIGHEDNYPNGNAALLKATS